jgi:hypothetical protein
MTPSQFVGERTIASVGSGIRLGPLRKAYCAEFGHYARQPFLMDLIAAGFSLIAEEKKGTMIVGRAYKPAPVSRRQGISADASTSET